jgi:hypothetical protein
MLSGTVHKTSHAFLHGPVLCVHALNASKTPGLLCLSIQQVVVFPISLRAKGRLVDLERAIARTAFEPVCLVQRLVRVLYSQLYTMVLSSSMGPQMWPATKGLPRSIVEGRS